MSSVPVIPALDQLHFDAVKLVNDVQLLRTGKPPFHRLTLDERNEQLAALELPVIPAPAPAPAPARFAWLGRMTDAQLIELVSMVDERYPLTCIEHESDREPFIAEATAELLRRLDTPADDEREEIEDRIATMDVESAIDAAESRVAIIVD